MRLKRVINGLIHACDELSDLKSNRERGRKVWKVIAILAIATFLLIAFRKQLGIPERVLATATILGASGTWFFGIVNRWFPCKQ